jgi:hypothetical protein
MAKSRSSKSSSPCVEVAKGGVGESGASSLVVHPVSAKIAKLMVLRTVASSLCPNTGAVAILSVNGSVQASGTITAVGSSIQAEAGPGDWVAGIVHTVPLFNDISCIRLGELSYRLDECDLVTTAKGSGETTATTTAASGSVVPCQGVQTRDWYAWNDLMPPGPNDLHVVGEVYVPNPGVDPYLLPRHPPAKGKTLALELVLVQRPGVWPQMLVWKPVRYDKVLRGRGYRTVEIYCGDQKIETIDIEDTH